MKLINQNNIVQLNIYRRFEKESNEHILCYKKNEPVMKKRWFFFKEKFTPKENLYSYYLYIGTPKLRTIKELEEYADERFIPIIQREVKSFLSSLLEYKRPYRILEVL